MLIRGAANINTGTIWPNDHAWLLESRPSIVLPGDKSSIRRQIPQRKAVKTQLTYTS